MRHLIFIIIVTYFNGLIHHRICKLIRSTEINNKLFPKHYCTISVVFQKLCRIKTSYNLIPRVYKIMLIMNMLIWIMIFLCAITAFWGETVFGIVFSIVFIVESVVILTVYISRGIFQKNRTGLNDKTK